MKKNSFLRIFYICCCITLLGCGCVLGILHHYTNELPPLSKLKEYELMNGTRVYDKTGKLIKIFASEHRRVVSLSEIPDTLIHAFLAIEDAKFYNHVGFDFSAILRAVIANLTSRGISQGASTITQQLARDMFLNRDQNYARKIKEILLALRIERTFSKDQILEMYLNKTYLGGGNYGVESAAQNYFGKSVKDITLAECALLARLPQAPSYLNPLIHYDESVQRSHAVLAQMKQHGYITTQQYDHAITDTIRLAKQKTMKDPAGYFLEYVRKYVEHKYGTSMLYTGGLNVYTTMDWDLTVFADSVLNTHLTQYEQKRNYDIKYTDFPEDTTDIDTKYIQGGVYAIDPTTGYVAAMIGGRNFNHSKFNRITQRPGRQPGSAFKPFVYAAALGNGYTPATMINDLPIQFMQDDTVYFQPYNYSKKFYGLTRLRRALQHSRNIPAIRILADISPAEAIRYARLCGIESYLPPYLSLVLGTAVVLPEEIIAAYAPFANGGERIKPIYIRRIVNENGTILETHESQLTRVMSQQLAFVINNVMQSVMRAGTGAGIRWRGFTLPAGGKTGTTDNFQDAWCIGFTTRMVLGIWVGFDDNISLGKGQAGAYVAVPPWPYIMNHAVYNESQKDSLGKPIIDKSLYEFPEPNGIAHVTICDTTGLLPHSFEQKLYDEVFISGTEPTIISDSLGYNFEPIGYQNLDLDTLRVDVDSLFSQYKRR